MFQKFLLAAVTGLFAVALTSVAPEPAHAFGFKNKGCLKAAKIAHPGKLKPKLACVFNAGKKRA
jgi:hypothetical protein